MSVSRSMKPDWTASRKAVDWARLLRRLAPVIQPRSWTWSSHAIRPPDSTRLRTGRDSRLTGTLWTRRSR